MCAAASGVVVVNGSIERLSIIELLTHVLAIVERFGFFFFLLAPESPVVCVCVGGGGHLPLLSINRLSMGRIRRYGAMWP